MPSLGNTIKKQLPSEKPIRLRIRSILSKPGSREIQILTALIASLMIIAGIFRLWPYLGIAIPIAALWTSFLAIGSIKRPQLIVHKWKLWAGITLSIVGTIGVAAIIRPGIAGFFGEQLVGYYPRLGIIQVLPIYIASIFIIQPKQSCRVLQTLGSHGLTFANTVIRFTYQSLIRLARLKHKHSLTNTTGWKSVKSRVPSFIRSKFSMININGIRESQENTQLQPIEETVTALLPTTTEDSSNSLDHPYKVSQPIGIQEENNLVIIPTPEYIPSGSSNYTDFSQGLLNPQQSLTPVQTTNGWSVPSLDLLRIGNQSPVPEAENQTKARLIETTLAEYGVEVTVEDVRPGPVVTQFGVVPGWIRKVKDVVETGTEGEVLRDEKGRLVKKRVEERKRVKVDTILSREKDLALALAARSLRFEAPVPGESFVGLEVPNDDPGTVTLRSLMESPAFKSLSGKGYLPIAFGSGSGGETVVADLVDMPHLLIAGATGSGKSVCINTIISSLLMQFTPEHLRLLLIDPKRVELSAYQGLPHLLRPVLVEVEESPPALRGLIAEMQLRYKRFQNVKARNIQTYNQRISNAEERMPYIVLVIDELADLMMTASNEVEQSLCRLAQLGRATGIHLVIATQRPSVDVLTGLIKANFPSRISFVVSSHIDSRTILDGVGAETLLGRGDMLFLPTDYMKPKRMQGAYISDDEVQNISNHWNKQQGVSLPPVTLDIVEEPVELFEDEMLTKARDLALQHNRISASLLQRKLGIGFARASNLLDNLEERGIVEPGDPGKSRAVTLGNISTDQEES